MNINSLSKGAKTILQNNPYYILGISSLASVEEANEAVNSMKQLEALGVASSYDAKTQFNIEGITGITRNYSRMQAALADMSDANKRWFWFSSTQIECNGQVYDLQSNWLDILEIDSLVGASYDAFLLYLLVLLVKDPQFKCIEKWEQVFGYADDVASWNEVIVSDITASGADIKCFRTEIETIVFDAIISAGIETACRIYPTLDYYCNFMSMEDSNGFVHTLLARILEYFVQWAEVSVTELVALDNALSKTCSNKENSLHLNRKDAYQLLIALSEFFSKYWDDFRCIMRFAGEQDDERITDCKKQVQEIVIRPATHVMNMLHYASNGLYEVEATRAYSMLYIYIKDVFQWAEENWQQDFNTDFLYFGLPRFSDQQLLEKGRYECCNVQHGLVDSVKKELHKRGSRLEDVLIFEDYIRMNKVDMAEHVFRLNMKILPRVKFRGNDCVRYVELHDVGMELFYMNLYLNLVIENREYCDTQNATLNDWLCECFEEMRNALCSIELDKMFQTAKNDYERLFCWYLLMSKYKHGDRTVCEELAKYYNHGYVFGRDRMMADFFACQGKDNSAYCKYHYGVALYKGIGRPRNIEQGLSYIRAAANMGYSEAQSFMKYLDGVS
jgi:hypothetical protein